MVEIRFFGYGGLLRQLRLAVVLLVFLATANYQNLALAQTQAPPRSELERKLEEQTQDKPSDVVRVRTDLVQTTLSVLNKSGKFVDNLRAEDFELRVDGKPHPVLFFDRVVNGVAERLNTNKESVSRGGSLTAPEDKTRMVLFFVDDFHLSSESMLRTRKMLSHYIEEEMGPNDQAVIVSASGRIGFLQQVTENKDVLRAAFERLTYRAQDSLDSGRPRMSAHQASAIEKGDVDVRMYFEDVLIKDMLGDLWRRNPQRAREVAEVSTRNRASRIVRQADIITKQTLSALDRAIRSSAQVSGRKLMFFVSDGFLVNNQNPDIRDRLQRITDAAARVGAVLYTVQASGLNTIMPDASSDAQLIAGSGTGRSTGEDMDLQEPLMELAADSGGKALLNANDLNQSVKGALRESNDYYLLAWRPETAISSGNQFHRIEVTVKGHPELAVLVQRGFFKETQAATVIPAKAEKRKVPIDPKVEDLAAAIKGNVGGGLQTSVMANYLDVPGRGARLSVLMRVDRPVSSSQNSGKAEAIDIGGVIYDESGDVIGSFIESLKPEKSDNQHVAYLNQFDVKPGLYQVRGAARDSSGATGMAMQWVKVPDLGARRLTLSSLLIGERELTHAATPAEAMLSQKAQLKIDRRFVSNSRLRFVTFIYNARDEISQAPRLNARVDIFRGNKPVVSTPSLVIDTSNVADSARIPYAGEINLASLARGSYLMRVTVIDLNAKAFASQETAFAIE